MLCFPRRCSTLSDILIIKTMKLGKCNFSGEHYFFPIRFPCDFFMPGLREVPLPVPRLPSVDVCSRLCAHSWLHVGICQHVHCSRSCRSTRCPRWTEEELGNVCVCVTSLSSLPQIDMFILGYSLEVKIKVFRLFKFNSRDFEVCYPEESLREWPEISLLTENDRHYHIPVF